MKVKFRLFIPYAIFLLSIVVFCLSCNEKPKEHNKEKQALAYNLLDRSTLCYRRLDYDSAFFYLDKVDSLAGDNDTLHMYVAAQRTVFFASQGKMTQALSPGHKAKDLAAKLQDMPTLIDMHSTLGAVYSRLGMNDSALQVYKEGAEIARHIKEKSYASNIINNIASFYLNLNRPDEAMAYSKEAEALASTTHSFFDLSSAKAMQARILVSQKKYDEAEKIIVPLMEKAWQSNNVHIILTCAQPLLNLYIETGQYHTAQKLFTRLHPFIEKTGQKGSAAVKILSSEALMYQKQHRYDKALAVWTRLERFKNSNRAVSPQQILFNKSLCYEHSGNMPKALQMLKNAYAMNDSLKDSAVERQMSEFSIRFKTQQKELELVRARKEQLEQRSHLTAIIVSLVLVCIALAGSIAIVVYRRRLSEKAWQIAMHQRFIEGMENERARLARELHDGTCNDLLGLSMMMAGEGSRCVDVVKQIRSNVRRISHELMPPRFTDTDINTVLADYLAHYPLPGCKVEYHATPEARWQDIPAFISYEIYRIVQETMNNITKYSQPTNVKVNLLLENGRLNLVIENNGYCTTGTNKGSGIGTQTLNDRVKSMDGEKKVSTHGDEYTMKVSVDLAKSHFLHQNKKNKNG